MLFPAMRVALVEAILDLLQGEAQEFLITFESDIGLVVSCPSIFRNRV